MNVDPTRTWESKFFDHTRQILGVAVSPCGNFAVTGDFDGQIQRWNLNGTGMTPLDHHQTWVHALAFHPDGRRLFSTDYWGNIACWNHTGDNPQTLWTRADAHTGWIRAALVSRDGQYLVTAGND